MDLCDFAILSGYWLTEHPPIDLDGFEGLGLADLAVLAHDWLVKEEFVIISEFLASNRNTLFDEDGKSSDWIEIYNPTRAEMSLEGWYLTDDRDDLMKWQLPAVALQGGEFLIVFASGKDRASAGGQLHTNFQLSTDDNYLALVKSDGETVVHSYDLNLNEQLPNVSFGINQQPQSSYLVPLGSAGKVLVPDAADDAQIGLTWNGNAAHEPFDDGGWESISLGVGYDARNSSAENIALGKPATQSSEWDGYPASFGTDGNLANFTHTATGDLTPWWDMDMQESYFINRIVLHNRDDCCQTRLYNITVEVFDAAETLVYMSPVLNETAEGGTPVSPGEFITVDLSVLPGGGVTARRIHISKTAVNGVSSSEWLSLGEVQVFGSKTYHDSIASNIQADMKGVNASCYIRIGFDAENADSFDKIVLRMKYDDGFIAYLNGTRFAAANAPAEPAYNAQAGAIHQALAFEEFSVPLSLLREGANILAIHGLNYHTDDLNFLILPELTAYRVDMSEAGYFTQPTPANLNGYSVAGFVTDTRFDVDRGFYDIPFEVHITSITPGATIIYTTNGSEPTLSNGTQVPPVNSGTTPVATVQVANTTVLRARAFRDGYEPSNTDTQTYIFLDDVITSGVMNTAITQDAQYAPNIKAGLRDIWTISIASDQVINDTVPVKFSVELIRPDEVKGFQEDVGIRYFGGAYTLFDKKNFRMYFQSEFGATQLRYPLFKEHERGIDTVEVFDQLELRSGSHDMSLRGFMMSNTFTDDTLLDMGNLNPHGQFVHLYWNGTYWGLYHLRERWNAAMHADYLGGNKEDYEAINGNLNVGGWSLGVPYDGDGSAWANLISLRNSYEAVQPFLDVQNYVDYMLMYMFGMPEDEYRCVGPLGPGTGFKFYLNDADGYAYSPDDCEIFGSYDKTAMNPSTRRANGDGPGGLFGTLFAEGNPDCRIFLADRIHKHYFNNGAMTPAQNTARLMQRYNQIKRAYIAESARWWGRTDLSPNSSPYLARTPLPDARNTLRKSLLEARDSYINKVLPSRTATVIGQFTAAGFYPQTTAPVFYIDGLYQHGGYVAVGQALTMTHSNPATVSTELVSEGAAVRAFVPANNTLGTTWTTQSFTPGTGWTDGSTGTGVGYDNGTAYDAMIRTNLQTQMYNLQTSAYCRIPFAVTNPSAIVTLKLQIKYDDGFIAYINGSEVCRSTNITNAVPPTAVAGGHTAASFEEFDISSYKSLLTTGANILAIHGINNSKTSSDLLVLPKLVAAVPAVSPPIIWYTLDGADPRLPGGTLNPDATSYTGPVVLNKNIHVKARVLIPPSEWSALNEAVYGIDNIRPNLRITELMYNPADPNCEFIELRNIGAQAINLNLTRFTRGISFVFGDLTLAPGAYTLVVAHAAEFANRYGAGLPVAGQYTGAMENKGERIQLVDALGTVIHDFEYQNNWFDITDGGGFSLTILNAANPDLPVWGQKAGWRPSSVVGGSPGGDDSGIVPPPGAIVVNEILSHSHDIDPDWIELYNTTADPIHIGGWFLSDSNIDDPNKMKYEIAVGTTIDGYGYKVFYQNLHFGNTVDPGCHIPFALGEGGETVYLQSALAGTLTGYVAEQQFDAAESGVAFGRYLKSTLDGGVNFVALAQNTPGGLNSAPKVGPIVITEIMYNPNAANTGDEYIELKNISDKAVTLQDEVGTEPSPGVYETDIVPWRFTDGIDFEFPAHTTISAGGLLIVAKDPGRLRAHYGAAIPGNVPILQWTTGKLENSGEKIRLCRPGDQEYGKDRFYIRKEQVTYNNVAPWPTEPDGTGKVLQRINPAAYGNDAANWQSADPMPGQYTL